MTAEQIASQLRCPQGELGKEFGRVMNLRNLSMILGALVQLDLQAGPQGETGVGCTEFKEWPSYKNGDAKTTFILRHANGRDETFEFTSRLGVWDDGPRGSIKRLCSSQESFTLWRWARTGVIADVE